MNLESTYTAKGIACYVINYCKKNGYYVSNLSLQKFLYYIQADFLVTNNAPCFKDRIEAWGFGVVVPSVYKRYLINGRTAIFEPYDEDYEYIAKEDKKIINEVCDECMKYSSVQLTEMCTQQKPWIDTYRHHKNGVIPLRLIRDFFK